MSDAGKLFTLVYLLVNRSSCLEAQRTFDKCSVMNEFSEAVLQRYGYSGFCPSGPGFRCAVFLVFFVRTQTRVVALLIVVELVVLGEVDLFCKVFPVVLAIRVGQFENALNAFELGTTRNVRASISDAFENHNLFCRKCREESTSSVFGFSLLVGNIAKLVRNPHTGHAPSVEKPADGCRENENATNQRNVDVV